MFRCLARGLNESKAAEKGGDTMGYAELILVVSNTFWIVVCFSLNYWWKHYTMKKLDEMTDTCVDAIERIGGDGDKALSTVTHMYCRIFEDVRRK